jgi:hypothetical protein
MQFYNVRYWNADGRRQKCNFAVKETLVPSSLRFRPLGKYHLTNID